MPQIEKTEGNFDFWVKLGHALHTAETVSLLTATAESTATWNTVIDRCLGAVLSQWSVAMHARYDYMHSNPHKVMRVIDALELFLSAERLDFCDKLFASVLETQNQDDLRKELREFWEPNSAKL